MDKEFVPYPFALRLKQIGFDEPCLAWYPTHEVLLFMGMKLGSTKLDFVTQNSPWIQSEKTKTCIAPTFSAAFEWFREKYMLYHSIDPLGYNMCLGLVGELGKLTSCNVPHYGTYEEAELACLEKLLEIVETLKIKD